MLKIAVNKLYPQCYARRENVAPTGLNEFLIVIFYKNIVSMRLKYHLKANALIINQCVSKFAHIYQFRFRQSPEPVRN